MAVESAYDPDAVSGKGALGLMQVIPETGERYGVTGDQKRTLTQKLLDPAINVQVGTRYLRDLLALFSDDVALALAAYNAGENTVQRYDNQIPPFPETQEFVKLVQQFYALYRPPPPPRPAATPARITIPPRSGAPRRRVDARRRRPRRVNSEPSPIRESRFRRQARAGSLRRAERCGGLPHRRRPRR